MFDLHKVKWWAPGTSCQSCGKVFEKEACEDPTNREGAYVLTRRDDSTGFAGRMFLCKDCLLELGRCIEALEPRISEKRIIEDFRNLTVGEEFTIGIHTLKVAPKFSPGLFWVLFCRRI